MPTSPNLGQLGQLVQVPIPTQAQREEVEIVRRLQIRTNALSYAVAVVQGQGKSVREVLEIAGAIEAWLTGSAEPG